LVDCRSRFSVAAAQAAIGATSHRHCHNHLGDWWRDNELGAEAQQQERQRVARYYQGEVQRREDAENVERAAALRPQ
jgi:hypothetical protein